MANATSNANALKLPSTRLVSARVSPATQRRFNLTLEATGKSAQEVISATVEAFIEANRARLAEYVNQLAAEVNEARS